MAHKPALEQRIATLEEEVARIKQQLRHKKVGRDWVKRVSGSLKDFPEFADVVRLGQELRAIRCAATVNWCEPPAGCVF